MAYPYRKRIKPRLGTPLNKGHRLSKGLVGAWLFNEGSGNKVFDLSGNGNIGTFDSTYTPSWSTGKFGAATNYNQSMVIDVADSLSLDSITSVITVVAWFRPTGNFGGSGRNVIAAKRNGASNGAFWLGVEKASGGGEALFNILQSDSTEKETDRESSKAILTADTWVQVVGVADGTNVKLYLDGVDRDVDIAYDGTILPDNYELHFGSSVTTANDIIGDIDHILLYNRALSASEIAQLYREPFAMFQKEDIAVLSPTNLLTGLVSYWKLDDNLSTSAVLDAHGSNDGTVVNDQTNYSSEQSTTGKIVRAFDLDGTNDNVDLGVGTSLSVTDNFTFVFWLKSDDKLVDSYVYGRDPSNTALQHAIISGYLDNNIEFFATGYTGSNPRTDSAIVIPDTTNWHQYAYSYDGSTWSGYRDGASIFSVSLTFSLAETIVSVRCKLGSSSVNTAYLNGLIDEVGTWNRALTSSEITELYNAGNGLAYPFTAVVGTNMKINIGDAFKDVDSIKINIGDVWKSVESVSINVGDSWKSVF